MFVPPEDRHPGSSPWDSEPPRRAMSSREKTVLLWLIGILLALTVLAPIGGGTVLQGLWSLLSQ